MLDIWLFAVALHSKFCGSPETMGRGIVGEGLETSVAPGITKHLGDVQPATCQSSVLGVFDDLIIILTTNKEGLRRRYVADALLVTVRLTTALETVGTDT